MCSPSIPAPPPPAPPPPAPVKMAEAASMPKAARQRRRSGQYGLNLLTIPMTGMQSGTQIPGSGS